MTPSFGREPNAPVRGNYEYDRRIIVTKLVFCGLLGNIMSVLMGIIHR